MKKLKLLGAYFRGIRIPSLLLTVMMTCVMLWGVLVFGQIQREISDQSVIKSADTENAYYVQYFPNAQDAMSNTGGKLAEKAEKKLMESPLVSDVFVTRVVNPLSYKEYGISIVLYEPEMLEFFPGLKRIGIDFSDDPEGCILGSQVFNGVPVGGQIGLDMVNKRRETVKEHFPVAGRIYSPYRYMLFSTSATQLSASMLFAEGNVILMQATDTQMERLSQAARRIEYDGNYIVVFKNGTTREEQEALLASVCRDCTATSFQEMLENTEKAVAETIKNYLPQPLFVLISATVAFLSILVLSFKKKEKELAVCCLCGCSRRRCGVTVFSVFNLIALFPVVFNVIFVLIGPYLEWKGILDLKLYTIDTMALVPILGYYLLTAAIALAVTVGAMSKHTPLTYLKEVSQ